MTSRNPQLFGFDTRRWERSTRALPPLVSHVMWLHRRMWQWTWGTILAVAAIPGVLIGGWANSATAVIMASTAAVALLLALERVDQPPRTSSGVRRGSALERGVTAGLGVGALVAAAGTLGPLALPLGLLACLTSPPAFRLLCSTIPEAHPPRPRLRRPRVPRPGPVVPSAPVVEVSALALRSAVQVLDDYQLCHGWRASYTCLVLAPTAAERLELVHVRQAYLDEMERRHPAGLRAWLDSGARAAGDPSRHLHLPGAPGER